ncbi:MAG: hypothetical protein M1503_01550 [Thaumarchaeota archaeon]|nr:hypothetical protein [Nitrososphaerota archaeon]MCL5316941.1 hypothetical protein [Nitrososphaerota archaeon]
MAVKITIIIALIATSLAAIPLPIAESQVQPEVTCITCHAAPASHVDFSNIACQTCHGNISTKPTPLTLNHQRIMSNSTGLSFSCSACHKQNLGLHSNLGAGDQACLVCHDGFKMQPHTLNGVLLTNVTVSNLCANCHRERYADWKIGVHGTHGLNYTSMSEGAAPSCITCHNPHPPDLPDVQTLESPERPERSAVTLAALLSPFMALIAGVAIFTVTISRRSGGV